MDIVPFTAGLVSATTSDAFGSLDASYSLLRGDSVTHKWHLGSHAKSEQLSVRLPGAGTVRVDVDKHVDKALKGKTNGLADGTKSSKPVGATKP